MINKKDKYLLPDARLIIGNGFDLSCGLSSSYQDYFSSKGNDYAWFERIYNILIYNFRLFEDYNVNSFPKCLPDNLNIWDLLFYLLSINEQTINNWYDVENVIKDSLFSNNGFIFSFSKFANDIDNYIKKRTFTDIAYDSSPFFLLKHFLIFELARGTFKNRDSFYRFLKEELKRFESDFIKYLEEEVKKIDYQNKASSLLKRIVGSDKYNVTEIDSFNYTKFDIDSVDYFNVNGDSSFPIFGVDNSKIEDSNDERKIFTKQYRRLERIVLNNPKPSMCGDECIYFYGHSLNEQDYDYFFTLFDGVDLLNDFDRKLVFAYSIYDESKEKEIINNYLNAIYALFFSYEKTKGIQSPRLLTRLMSEGKIEIKKV